MKKQTKKEQRVTYAVFSLTFYNRRATFNTGRIGEIDDALKNHETRLTALETKPSPAP